MAVIAALFGILLAFVGAAGVASPRGLLAWMSRLQSQRGLLTIAAIRIALGIVLLLAAPDSREPKFLSLFGVLALVSGLLTPFFGVRRFETIMGWWTKQSNLFLRVIFCVPILIGVCIVIAVRP